MTRILAIAISTISLVACTGAPPPTPSPTGSGPTAGPTATASASATPAATLSPLPTATPSLAVPTPTVAPTPTAAPTPTPVGWSEAQLVSDRHRLGSLAVDANGFAHAAASRGRGTDYLTNSTGQWTAERVSLPAQRDTFDSPQAILLADDGTPVILFTRYYGSVFGDLPGEMYTTIRGPAGWSSPAEVPAHGAGDISLRMRAGNVFGAYTEAPFDIVPETMPVYFVTDASGAWTKESVVEDGSRPDLQVGSDGTPRVLVASNFYNPSPGSGLRYAIGADHGGPFSIEAVPGTTADDYGSFAMDSSDGAHVLLTRVTRDPDGDPLTADIYYAVRDASGWREPQLVVTGGSLQSRVEIDSRNSLHFLILSGDATRYATQRAGTFEIVDMPAAESGPVDAEIVTFALDPAGRAHFVLIDPAEQLWYRMGPTP